MRGFGLIMFCGAALAILPFAALSAKAASSQWDHNNSVMKLEESGKKHRFIYEEPRNALKAAGVKRGTVLFDGEVKKDGRLAGYAKLFRKGCDPIDYFVEGSYDENKGEIFLQGQVPIYSGKGCKITGYSDNGSASSLRFTRIGEPEGHYAALPEQDERASYLPPEAITGGISQSRREKPAETVPPRSFSNREEETETHNNNVYENEQYEEEPRSPSYRFRSRRAERDGRYDEEDADYYAELEEEEREDPADYYDDDYGYYDEPGYYAPRPRWRRY